MLMTQFYLCQGETQVILKTNKASWLITSFLYSWEFILFDAKHRLQKLCIPAA
uniref:Uncharacterized protein n=1 Tax=Anguilla anguilla TaxID=7936 RepID=A0A0E9QPW6_ANGAN